MTFEVDFGLITSSSNLVTPSFSMGRGAAKREKNAVRGDGFFAYLRTPVIP
jgi:hypothetical protein